MFLARLLLVFFLISTNLFAASTTNIPILCYHNLNSTRPGSMNMTPTKFEMQLQWIINNGFTIIPLQQAVSYLAGKTNTLPKKSVVLTFDDGWQSDYTYLYPIIKKYKVPVTLFIYPGAISTTKHFLTWDELTELQKSGFFNIQGHTFTHPNFKQEKKHLSAERYNQLLTHELVDSKKILEEKMQKPITLLAWPFGIYNNDLEDAAKKAGYTMAFTIDYKSANRGYAPMGEPRFMIIDAESEKTFEGIVKRANS